MTARAQRMWPPIVTAAALAIAVALFGALVTDIGPWYYALHKPSWQPPDWLFGPVWTLIFGLAAVSAVLAWRHAMTPAQRTRVVLPFLVNMALNSLWSVMFFRWHRPDWALSEVAFLWLSIVALMWSLRPLSGLAAALFVPYLLWVSFAAYLNLTIVRLNPGFLPG